MDSQFHINNSVGMMRHANKLIKKKILPDGQNIRLILGM